MEMTVEKLVNLAKKHKKELIIGGAALVLLGGTILYGKHVLKVGEKMLANTPFVPDLPIPDFTPTILGVGEVTDLWREDSCVNLIVGQLTANDLGAVGEGIKNALSDLVDLNDISLVVGITGK